MEMIEKDKILNILNHFKAYFEENSYIFIENDMAVYLFSRLIEKINEMESVEIEVGDLNELHEDSSM